MPEIEAKKKKKPVIPKIYRDCAGVDLVPGPEHPVCVRCAMHCGKTNPFMRFVGSENPLLTVVLEGPSQKEDATGLLTSDSWNRYARKAIEAVAAQTGFPSDRIRYAAVTLCAPNKKDNLKTKGSWCRWFLMADLIEHPPVCILPVGTTAAGLLHSKGNTQDWQGRLLHWRGWPDDWISDARFDEGHPVLGRPPEPADSCWLVSVKHPRIIQAEATESARKEWVNAIAVALDVAANPPAAYDYDRPYFDLTTDADRIEAKLRYLAEHPQTLVSFDTETTGLQPWGALAKIVLMMFRWDGPDGPDSIAFPWEHTTSQLAGEVARLKPFVLEALYASKLQGHNLTFDCQFVMARLGADIVRLSDAMYRDTWHMHFTLRQIREAMGLDTMPHHWCPEWSGYEENMTLLIDKTPAMQPDKGGHYANCPPEKWDTHLKPYIMGDVEVVHQAAPRIEEALAATQSYRIPLASINKRGKFRFYSTPDRKFVAERIMAPANRMLTKLMGRGMYVDQAELDLQETETPKRIRETREQVRNADPRIIQWCDSKEATEPEWSFDLDKPATLKELLFDVLGLPIKRLTKGGRAEFGEDPNGWRRVPRDKLMAVAAADKFTLNSMAAEHEELRPLLEYRKVSKLYTTYVRPMRNLFTAGIDKKPRTKPAILMPDGCVHTSFLLCGTRGGRLCVAGDTFIEIRREAHNGTQSVLLPPRPIQIQDLRLSDENPTYVLSGKGTWRKITAVFLKGVEQMFDVRTEQGAFVRCTGGHRLDTPTGFQHVRDLSVGSLVKSDTGVSVALSSITPSTELPVWDIEVETDHSYVAGGFVHHNSSRSPNLQNVAKDGVIKALYASRFGKQGAIFQTDLCVAEGGRVSTLRGLVPIQNVMVGDKVHQEDGSSRRVTAVLRRGVKKCVTLTTECGFTFTATKDHRIRVIDVRGDYVWKRIEEIVATDVVAIQPEYACPEATYASLPDAPAKTFHRQSVINTPHRITAEFAEWFGFLIGNGSAVDGALCVRYVVCARDRDTFDRLMQFSKTFGIRVAILEYRGVIEARMSSVLLHRWVTSAGYSKMRVPDWAWELPDECLSAFIRGLFESDGSAGVATDDTQTNGQCVSFCSKNKQLTTDVQKLLLRLGVHAGLRFLKNKHAGGWNVRIYAESLGLFSEKVGFMGARKKSVLSALLARTRFPKKFGLPNQQHKLNEVVLAGEAYRVTNNVRVRNSVITHYAAPLIFDELPECSLKTSVLRYIQCGQRYETVRSAKDAGDVETWDIEVEDTHTFLVNGFVSHNSQIELRLLAAACGDPAMVEAYVRKLDLHSLTCSKLFNISYDDFSEEKQLWMQDHGQDKLLKEMSLKRRIAKVVNFLTGYGGGALGLQNVLAAQQIYLPIEECESIIDNFFDNYPGLRDHIAYYKNFVLENALAVSLTGRVRLFPEVHSADRQIQSKALRSGYNHLIQTSASDIMLACLIAVERAMENEGLQSLLVSTVHDSLVIDAKRDELDVINDICGDVFSSIPEVMQLVYGEDYDTSWMFVPLSGDRSCGASYLEERKIKADAATGRVDWDRLLAPSR